MNIDRYFSIQAFELQRSLCKDSFMSQVFVRSIIILSAATLLLSSCAAIDNFLATGAGDNNTSAEPPRAVTKRVPVPPTIQDFE